MCALIRVFTSAFFLAFRLFQSIVTEGESRLRVLMASNESPSVAPAGYVSSTGAGVSFSIAKRTQSRLVGKTGTLAETRDGRRGGSSMKEPEKDYIYSLEEGNIHR